MRRGDNLARHRRGSQEAPRGIRLPRGHRHRSRRLRRRLPAGVHRLRQGAKVPSAQQHQGQLRRQGCPQRRGPRGDRRRGFGGRRRRAQRGRQDPRRRRLPRGQQAEGRRGRDDRRAHRHRQVPRQGPVPIVRDDNLRGIRPHGSRRGGLQLAVGRHLKDPHR